MLRKYIILMTACALLYCPLPGGPVLMADQGGKLPPDQARVVEKAYKLGVLGQFVSRSRPKEEAMRVVKGYFNLSRNLSVDAKLSPKLKEAFARGYSEAKNGTASPLLNGGKYESAQFNPAMLKREYRVLVEEQGAERVFAQAMTACARAWADLASVPGRTAPKLAEVAAQATGLMALNPDYNCAFKPDEAQDRIVITVKGSVYARDRYWLKP